MMLSRLSEGCRNERLSDEITDRKKEQATKTQKKASICSWVLIAKYERWVEERIHMHKWCKHLCSEEGGGTLLSEGHWRCYPAVICYEDHGFSSWTAISEGAGHTLRVMSAEALAVWTMGDRKIRREWREVSYFLQSTVWDHGTICLQMYCCL